MLKLNPMSNKPFSVAMLLVSCLALSGCASAPPEEQFSCKGTDWFELGRRDGTAGQATSFIETHRKECSKEFNQQTEAYYMNGYNKGLVDYCSVENGFVLGRAGQPMKPVCPSPMDRSFMIGFNRGQRVYQLERANTQIERKISSINQQLKNKSVRTDQKEALTTELSQLENVRLQNNKELGRIEKRSQL